MCEDQSLFSSACVKTGTGGQAHMDPALWNSPQPQWHEPSRQSSLIYVFPRQHVKWPCVMTSFCFICAINSGVLQGVCHSVSAWLWPGYSQCYKRAYKYFWGVRAFLWDRCLLHPMLWVMGGGQRFHPANDIPSIPFTENATFAQAILSSPLSLQVP